MPLGSGFLGGLPMKRKVVKQGPATFMISLPSKWVKKYSVQKGDEVEVEEKGPSLIISKEKAAKKIKKATIDIEGFNRMLVNRYLNEFYRMGVEEIVINFKSSTMNDPKYGKEIEVEKHIRKLLDRYIGMEIISQTKNRIIIQSIISKEECNKIDVVQKRIYFLIKELFEEFTRAMDTDFHKFYEKMYDYHDNIVKFIWYYLRLLNFSNLPEEKKSRLFGLYIMIDRMIDEIRHCSERINEIKKISPKLKEQIQDILNIFLEMFDPLMKDTYSAEDLNSLIRRRYDVVKKVNSGRLTADEARAVGEIKIMLDMIADFCENYVVLNMEKHVSEV